MKPPDLALRELVAQWIEKAGADFDAAAHLLREGARFRTIIAFHCQQAAEKYLKAVLVRHQVEFPKTHDIGLLIRLISYADARLAAAVKDADALTPFGVEARYPSDTPEMLPGAEVAAFNAAKTVRQEVMALLEAYLAGH